MTRIDTHQSSKLTFAESAAPATPAAGLLYVYAKTDGSIYAKNDAGTETALDGAAGGITRGTSFPGGPSTGDLYQRSDIGELIFVYDGTNWVTQAEFSMSDYAVDTVTGLKATGNFPSMFSSIQPVSFSVGAYVATTNNGSHYWTIGAERVPDGGLFSGATVVMSIDTSAESADVYNFLEDTTGTAFALPIGVFGFRWTKTGSPGQLTIGITFTYRGIAT